MIDIITHLVAFLAGTAAAMAGQYMADRFTDQRRKNEALAHAKGTFKHVFAAAPKLISELKSEMSLPVNAQVQEFVVLANMGIVFESDRRRLRILESDHPDLYNQISLMQEAGLLRKNLETAAPIYRMSTEFIATLKSDA